MRVNRHLLVIYKYGDDNIMLICSHTLSHKNTSVSSLKLFVARILFACLRNLFNDFSFKSNSLGKMIIRYLYIVYDHDNGASINFSSIDIPGRREEKRRRRYNAYIYKCCCCLWSCTNSLTLSSLFVYNKNLIAIWLYGVPIIAHCIVVVVVVVVYLSSMNELVAASAR